MIGFGTPLLVVLLTLSGSDGVAPFREPAPIVFELTTLDEVFESSGSPPDLFNSPDLSNAGSEVQIPTWIDDYRIVPTQEVRPLAPTPGQSLQSPPPQSAAADRLAESVFGPGRGDIPRSLLTDARRSLIESAASETVFGQDAKTRITSDAGSLLGKSPTTPGVTVQRRTPIMSDPRVRGSRPGQLMASGSYWVPARLDLDTMLSKIDSRLVQRMTVIKGPYSALYGPGFDFIDVELVGAPRYENGPEWHGSTGADYQTNGDQWYGRQSVYGGSRNWGARIDYGLKTGKDYTAGDGRKLPSGYQSNDLNSVIGVDLSADSHLDFRYMHLDQYNVQFPGLVFDINHLYTDAYEANYVVENQEYFDLLSVEGWYNRTRFSGDTLRGSKDSQIPSLKDNLYPFNKPVPGLFDKDTPGIAVTNVDSTSTGYQALMNWGDATSSQFTTGLDMRYLHQELNDVEVLRPDVSVEHSSRNFPIPASFQMNPGLLGEYQHVLADGRWRIRTGGRLDGVVMDAANEVQGRALTMTEFQRGAPLNRNFVLYSMYASTDYDLDSHWTAVGSAGYAQRPPTMTELYAAGPFLGTLQPGLTYMVGDATISPERRTQVDAALKADYGTWRGSLRGFFAWVNDYVTYDAVLGLPPNPGQDFFEVAFTNTNLALLSGFEAYHEYDAANWLTTFATLSYLQGTDMTRSTPGRLAALLRPDQQAPRSMFADSDTEPLPGIVPLESRLGFRLHEAAPKPRYGMELGARVVATQTRVAASLGEQRTGGFTVWDIRGYWQATRQLFVTTGVENFTNKFYREHLDYRTGLGVYQPGTNFYFGAEMTY